MSVPDLQIKTRVRAVLTKHWVDLARIDFECCRGSIRFRGEISLPVEHRCSSPAALIDALETEIKQIPGVKSVYLVGVTVNENSVASSGERSSAESGNLELTISDAEVKARVRAVLARHRIDVSQLGFECSSGTVTFRGKICFVDNSQTVDSGAAFLESLQVELKRLPGVRKVYFMGLKFVRASEEQEAPAKMIVFNSQRVRRRS